MQGCRCRCAAQRDLYELHMHNYLIRNLIVELNAYTPDNMHMTHNTCIHSYMYIIAIYVCMHTSICVGLNMMWDNVTSWRPDTSTLTQAGAFGKLVHSRICHINVVRCCWERVRNSRTTQAYLIQIPSDLVHDIEFATHHNVLEASGSSWSDPYITHTHSLSTIDIGICSYFILELVMSCRLFYIKLFHDGRWVCLLEWWLIA